MPDDKTRDELRKAVAARGYRSAYGEPAVNEDDAISLLFKGEYADLPPAPDPDEPDPAEEELRETARRVFGRKEDTE